MDAIIEAIAGQFIAVILFLMIVIAPVALVFFWPAD